MKFNIKHIMIIVFISAFSVGSYILWSRSTAYQRKARYHAQQKLFHSREAEEFAKLARFASKEIETYRARLAEASKEATQARREQARLVEESREASQARRGLADTKTSKRAKVTEEYARRLTELHALSAEIAEMDLGVQRSLLRDEQVGFANSHASEAKERRIAIHHESLRKKYQRASSMPWLIVAPDPPAPPPP